MSIDLGKNSMELMAENTILLRNTRSSLLLAYNGSSYVSKTSVTRNRAYKYYIVDNL